MEHFITRQQALQNEVFASFIGTWQQRFDPRENSYMTKAGSYYDFEIKKQRYYDQSEIDKINEQELDDFMSRKDNIEIKQLNYFGELKYNGQGTAIFPYSIELGKVLKHLSTELDQSLIFILDYDIPWLAQKSDFEPVAKALQYLKDIGTTEHYTGAYQFSGEQLQDFVANLFWIIRCNASLPYCWFSTNIHHFVGSICKYGNLHFYTYSESIKNQLENFAKKQSLFQLIECVEAFSTDRSIDGRQIDI